MSRAQPSYWAHNAWYEVRPMDASRCFILNEDHSVIKVTGMEWSRWFNGNTNKRIVCRSEINGQRVSTVFLGLDHSYVDGGPPMIFETMYMGGGDDDYMRRYSTWDQAVLGHTEVIQEVLWDINQS